MDGPARYVWLAAALALALAGPAGCWQAARADLARVHAWMNVASQPSPPARVGIRIR